MGQGQGLKANGAQGFGSVAGGIGLLGPRSPGSGGESIGSFRLGLQGS